MSEPDVVIVGSGPAAVSAAWPMVSAGLSVCLLGGGRPALPKSPKAESFSGWRASAQSWADVIGEDFGGGRTHNNYSPKFGTPLARAILADSASYDPEIRTTNAVAIRALVPGGLSTLWGGFCSMYSDEDLRGFPFRSSELERGYKAVARRIGIAGADDGVDDFLGQGLPLMQPSPLSRAARRVLERHKESKRVDDRFLLGHARNAVITSKVGNPDRSPCVECGLCLFGCGHKSIYNSADELRLLDRSQNFKYLPNAYVLKLLALDTDRKRLLVQQDGKMFEIGAKTLVLAAGTLNTTGLVLEYYDLWGREIRLLSNPVAGRAFIVPGLIGSPMPDKGFALGQLSYQLAINDDKYATGVMYSAETLPPTLLADRMPLTRPTALRLSTALIPAILITTIYLDSDFSDLKLALCKEGARKVISVVGNIPALTALSLRKAGASLGKRMRGLGAYPVPGSFTISPPGADAHLAGTIPMNNRTGPLSCNSWCELSQSKNVFVIDGCWFPRLPPKHCTFTIMANAARVGEQIAERVRGGCT